MMLTFIPSEKASASRQLPLLELEPGQRYHLDLAHDELNAEFDLAPEIEEQWLTLKVRKGDNLAKLFERAKLSPQDVYRVSKGGKDAKKLLKMMPGDELSLLIDDDGQLQKLHYAMSKTQTLVVNRTGEKRYESSIEQQAIQTRLTYAQGDIRSNFWNAGVEAGLSDGQIMSLAGIFGWDIDFALEIRNGDQFFVVAEQRFLNGEYLGPGDIVAAEFVNQGETFTALRHSDGNYYTPEGRSMRKSFLRAPLDFTRISSNFTKRRFHPVQKRWKAHRGVDYAAPRGTPVVAAGDGKVIRSGYDKYNGHHVFVQHGEKYTTKYIHFTKRYVKKGQFVKQGQRIGSVGSTGLALGPHLHYEFLVDGVHRNPRTVKLPKANPIAKSERDKFQALAANYMQHLANNKRIMLAMN